MRHPKAKPLFSDGQIELLKDALLALVTAWEQVTTDWLSENQVTLDEAYNLCGRLASFIRGALALESNEQIEFIVRGELEFSTH